MLNNHDLNVNALLGPDLENKIILFYKEVTHIICFDECELKIIDLSEKKCN
jgi:hypothetical protein